MISQCAITGRVTYTIAGEQIGVFDPPVLINKAKGYWFRVLTYGDLNDHDARRTKNLGTPVRSGLPQIEFSSDPELWSKLGQIQTSLRADMSPYYSWPLRVSHLFTGEFLGVFRRIEDQHPTWVLLITWIGEKVGVLNLSYNHYLRLHEFSSQVEPGDSARDVLMKLYTSAQSVPPNLMSPNALITTIKTQLHRFLPRAYDRMITQHAQEEETPVLWLESLISLPNRGFDLGNPQQSKPMEVVKIPRPIPSVTASPAVPPPADALALPPPQSIHPVGGQESNACFRCGKKGHWAKNCRVHRSPLRSAV